MIEEKIQTNDPSLLRYKVVDPLLEIRDVVKANKEQIARIETKLDLVIRFLVDPTRAIVLGDGM